MFPRGGEKAVIKIDKKAFGMAIKMIYVMARALKWALQYGYCLLERLHRVED